MLTKWVKKLLLPGLQDLILPAAESVYVNYGIVNVKTVLNENTIINGYSYSHDYTVRIKSVTQEAGVWIGSGDTPATENDYFLETPITSGCTGASTKQSIYDSTTNSITVRLLITITNTGNSDLVIKEIGKTCLWGTANSIGGVITSNRKAVMVDRTVLSSPVTIPAGESGVIHYDFVYFDGSQEPVSSASGA